MNEKQKKIKAIRMNAESVFGQMTNALCSIAAAPEDLASGQSVYTLTSDEKNEVISLLASAGMDVKKIMELCLEVEELLGKENSL